MNGTRRRVVLTAALVVLGTLTACEIVDPQESGSLLVVAMAGPTCPVETDPPDPECAPRPVAGAIVAVYADRSDVIVAEGATGEDGQLTLAVPAGDYVVTGGEVDGLMGAPQPVLVSVLPGVTIEVGLAYDTGIR